MIDLPAVQGRIFSSEDPHLRAGWQGEHRAAIDGKRNIQRSSTATRLFRDQAAGSTIVVTPTGRCEGREMDRIFEAGEYFTVPDGTDVSAFLNATDVTQKNLPWDAVGDVSIASGRVPAGVHSWVHVLPVVTQVTYIVGGQLTVRMKDVDRPRFYDNALTSGQAVVARPGTLNQLRNDTDLDAYVLYIVSPSYVFHMEGDEVVYDDAVLVTQTWEELLEHDYEVPQLRIDVADVWAKRDAARRSLKTTKDINGGQT
ncbi:hypothetical protein ACFQ58_10465 [Agromyces sp. NPDC056523]|uniref:hypothetical protein n=1 Tax=Agromyces sp. NPDC056523 TaxID=3345850 RepID=UPI00366BAD93